MRTKLKRRRESVHVQRVPLLMPDADTKGARHGPPSYLFGPKILYLILHTSIKARMFGLMWKVNIRTILGPILDQLKR